MEYLFFFDGKFLEFLKPFFQKGFKQVRTASATFSRPSHDLLQKNIGKILQRTCGDGKNPL